METELWLLPLAFGYLMSFSVSAVRCGVDISRRHWMNRGTTLQSGNLLITALCS